MTAIQVLYCFMVLVSILIYFKMLKMIYDSYVDIEDTPQMVMATIIFTTSVGFCCWGLYENNTISQITFAIVVCCNTTIVWSFTIFRILKILKGK